MSKLPDKTDSFQTGVLMYSELEKWLQEHDRTSYYGLRTLRAMQGDKVLLVASDILRFITHHYRGDAWADYTKRVEGLRLLQKEFEKTGTYSARSYGEVKVADDETYKLALLISFVCTNHRFEILKAKFFRVLRNKRLTQKNLHPMVIADTNMDHEIHTSVWGLQSQIASEDVWEALGGGLVARHPVLCDQRPSRQLVRPILVPGLGDGRRLE